VPLARLLVPRRAALLGATVVAAAATVQDAGLTVVDGGGLSGMQQLGHPFEN